MDWFFHFIVSLGQQSQFFEIFRSIKNRSTNHLRLHISFLQNKKKIRPRCVFLIVGAFNFLMSAEPLKPTHRTPGV